MPLPRLNSKIAIPLLGIVEGLAGTGKTSMALELGFNPDANRYDPILFVDLDGRLSEKGHIGDSRPIYRITAADFAPDAAPDNWMEKITKLGKYLSTELPGSGVTGIVVDSVTPIMERLKMLAKIDPTSKNGIAAYGDKANVMKLLQQVVFAHGINVLVIHHVEPTTDINDPNRKGVERTTMTQTELVRLLKQVNFRLKITQEGNDRFATVLFSRWRFGQKIKANKDWIGFFPQLRQEMYGGLSAEQMAQLSSGGAPPEFADRTHAASWAFHAHPEIWTHEKHCVNALAKMIDGIQKEQRTRPNIRNAWVKEVDRRLSILESEGIDNAGDEPEPTTEATETPVAPVEATQPPTAPTEATQPPTAPVEAAQPPTAPVEAAQPPTAPVEATEPLTAPNAVEAIVSRLTDDAKEYIRAIEASANGKVVSAVQVATLRSAITAAAGWSVSSPEDKIALIANVLCGRETGDLESYPAGAFTSLAGIIKTMKGKNNPNFDESKAAIVKQIADVVLSV
jgi:hypothetical protein